ncbi:MAG: KH domain-containing protein [archaeon]
MRREFVVPGEEVDPRLKEYTYSEGGKVYSSIYGLLVEKEGQVRLSPLKQKYIPKQNDIVIGIIKEEKFGGYYVDINSPYEAILETERKYPEGSIIIAVVSEITEVKSAVLTKERKISGNLIEVNPAKIPRVIGKKNSMINLLREKTGCSIYVGANGRVCISGENLILVEKAIQKIEQEAHLEGLTEKIIDFLEKEKVNLSKK